MLRTIALFASVTLVAVAFAVILLSGEPLKKPFSSEDDVMGKLAAVEGAIEAEKWETARENWAETKAAWDRVASRIQFSVEREMLWEISRGLSELEGTILAKDPQEATVTITRLRASWSELGGGP